MLSQRRAPRYSHPDWITIGVAIATVATILAGASVTGIVLVSQAKPQTVTDDFREVVRIGLMIYGAFSLFAYGTALANALAPIFDPNDAMRLRHVRSAARYFLVQGLMITAFAILVILMSVLPLDGTSEQDSRSSTAPVQTGEPSGLNESAHGAHCPVSGHE